MTPRPVAADVEAAVSFVQAIHGHERAGFAILMLKRGDAPPSHYGFALGNPQWDALRRVLANHAGADCYLGVAVYAAPPQPGKNRLKGMVLHCHWLWCERDDHPLPGSVPEPTFTIETSEGNYQDWWRMDAPLSLSDAEEYAERIAAAVGCAPMKDATRVLRIVGMKNHKPARHGEVAQITGETGAAYSLGDFAHLPKVSTPAAPVREGGPRGKIGEGHRHHELLSLAGSLRRRGMSRDVILAALREMNETQCDPPKPDAEIERIASDAAGWEPAPVEPVRASEAAKDYADTLPPDGGREGTPATAPYPESLASEAFYGLPGAIVRASEPHTESDPAALLIQLLVGAGNLIGGTPTLMMDGAAHHPNLFAVLVGITAKARKGTSWRQVRRVLAMVDPGWADKRITGGLSSGEGLIEAVADPPSDDNPPPEPTDKRLMIQVGEFASVLAVQGREGNTLSAVLRDAWDGDTLTVLNRKANKLRATSPHISMVAHVTRDELLRMLQTTEAANGYANRFLWAAVRRSKSLPRGGNLTDAMLIPLAEQLKAAVEQARRTQHLDLTEDAWELWDTVYAELSKEQAGLLGAITARAEPLVLRLAMIYALMDGTAMIDVPHLAAGCAVWEYCQQSAAWIFGDRLGDPDGDLLLSHLRQRPEGITRTEIHGLFGRNRSAAQVNRALTSLEEKNLARRVEEVPDGDRRQRTERWYAITQEGK